MKKRIHNFNAQEAIFRKKLESEIKKEKLFLRIEWQYKFENRLI